MNLLVKITMAAVASLALLVPAAVAAERPDDRAGVRGPGAFSHQLELDPLIADAIRAARPDDRAGVRGPGGIAADVAGTLPGDSGVPFWPHETGTRVGTSETFTQVREDGSYVDPSLGRRVTVDATVEALPGSGREIVAQERGRRSDLRLFSPSGSIPVAVAAPHEGFDLTDAGIGAGALAGVLAAVLAGMLAVRYSRRQLRHV